MSKASVNVSYRGCLKGHNDWVTRIAVCPRDDVLISSGRDKKLVVWNTEPSLEDPTSCGTIRKVLTGHAEAISDCSLSNGARFALTSSWDKTLKLWDLAQGEAVCKYTGHTKDVLSLAFSADECKILSASRDKTIKLWNTKGDCKYTLTEQQHTDWISCVRFSPTVQTNMFVSCGWDKCIKVWNLKSCVVEHNLHGHTGPVHTVTISPDGSLCASGGKDGVCMLWDVLNGKHLYSLDANDASPVNELGFSPCNYWLAVGADNSVKIWDLQNKHVLTDIRIQKDESSTNVDEAEIVEFHRNTLLETVDGHRQHSSYLPWATCVAWSASGRTLYVGSSLGNIYVFDVSSESD
ncbi:MAG: uncharacterized protein KVP18_000453 [Porospora cf. gigantea A]|uniref:uncharacterized protein n=1 Tax=Porospora cf. gigantea A TaxID=2853593 RepID=UPI00355AC2DB|nr:MAG: hypothetical protein KVP18_000453 [Porospora cf. gigantea A]